MNKRQKKKQIKTGMDIFLKLRPEIMQDILYKKYDETDSEFIRRVMHKYKKRFKYE